MDVVGGIASVAQLIAYSHVVAQRLVQLYKAAQEGPSCCRTQQSNIRFLLELIQRICTDEAPNTDAILPLLIATVNLANSLLRLLQPKGTLYNRWLWISKGQEIESKFCALNDKTRLLQLHITERTYSIVAHVQKDIRHMNQSLEYRPSHMDQSVCANHYPRNHPYPADLSFFFHLLAFYLMRLDQLKTIRRLQEWSTCLEAELDNPIDDFTTFLRIQSQ